MSTIGMQDFERIVEALRRNVDYYENCLETNRYFMGLANGDNLNISFPRSKVPHLLGVRMDKLSAAGVVRLDTPVYDVVKKIINCDLTYIGLQNLKFDVDNLFSDYIEQKLYIFSDIVKLRTDDLVCIIKYYSDRTYTIGEQAQNSDYFIIRKHEGNTYSALGIKQENENSGYIPVTSRYFEDRDKLNEFLATLRNQEVTYPHTFAVQNYFKSYQNKFYSKIESKLDWCRTSKILSDKFGLVPVNNNDSIITLERLLNSVRDRENSKSIMFYMADSIKNKSLIDKNEILETKDLSVIPEEHINLIDVINDHIYSNSNLSYDVGDEYSYTGFKNEIEILDRKLSEKDNELQCTKADLIAARNEIESLKAQLAATQQYLNIYEEAHNKVLELRKTNEESEKTL